MNQDNVGCSLPSDVDWGMFVTEEGGRGATTD